jgi:hypothetical protein
MAFDHATRNRLSKFVSDTRKLLSEEFAQQMRVKYGLDPATGVVTEIDKLPTMAEGDRQTAQMLRDTLEHYLATAPKRDKKTIASTIDRIVREQAFTVLNRLCAVRMAESRELVIESIAQGTKSKGFQLYARLAGSALGETGEAYVCYLFSLFDELSIDLPVLFDRFSPSGRLFPRESVLLDVLGQINHHELQHLWAEDETIGWIYQYFNSEAERKKMRNESSTPRNSRELAVRNQFFTPRYVVEFLTDNTLGRIWYEMTQGQTRLVDNCKYLVRRPDEVFLSQMTNKDQEHPSEGTIAMAELLLSGTEVMFPEFKADDRQPMIELAHCVSAYATMGDRAHDILGNRTLFVRERSVHEPTEIADAVEAAPYVFASQLETLKTQHILEVLFMTCRNDRHGGDGSVYSESWFVDACNEVRRRVLNSRRDDLSQEEQLRQPVFILYRPMKDPRDIKMLDPACGSMHFGLYAFDLFEVIYDEYLCGHLQTSIKVGEAANNNLLVPKDFPRLINECNIHGIDIDPRAVQIAGLSLWLRAQKSWQAQGVKAQARPPIQRSNIVCAEPMPGEASMLDEFAAGLHPRVLGQLVKIIFEKMKLAGEAGSLLKIEDEIADAVQLAHQEYKKFILEKKQVEGFLPGMAPERQATLFDFAELPNAEVFWDQAEELLLAALNDFSQQAENHGGYQRRLFAEDAARGFAFIDICKKLYDVVLMNPPFGDASLPSKAYIEDTYGDTKGDVYKAFVECFHARLVPAGYLGIISSRTGFFLGQSEDWRTRVVLRLFRPMVLADLGSGVLDAMVEVAAYVLRSLSAAESRDLTHSIVPVLAKVVRDSQDRFSLPKWQAARGGLKRHQAVAELEHLEAHGFVQRSSGDIVRYTPLWHLVKMVTDLSHTIYPPFACIRAINDVDKGATLAEAVRVMDRSRTTISNPAEFAEIPGSPFAYWVSPALRSLFKKFSPLQRGIVRLGKGPDTGDDFRFFRLWWEPDGSPKNRTQWVNHPKGGEFARYYSDPHLVIDWSSDGGIVGMHGNLRNPYMLRRPGLTWSRRTTSDLSVRALPRDCIFGDKGPALVVGDNNERMLLGLLAVLNSDPFAKLVEVQLAAADAAARSYEVGILSTTPAPKIDPVSEATLAGLAERAWTTKHGLNGGECTSHVFLLPALLATPGSTLVGRAATWSARVRTIEETVAAIQAEIDDLAFRLYGLDAADRAALTYTLATEATGDADAKAKAGEDEDTEAATADTAALTTDLLAYMLGVAFGLWDVRYATGEKAASEMTNPFATLPICPPGQLQNAQGLPARPEDVLALYPVRIPWDGILVDDPNHPLDIERRVREVIEIIWSCKEVGPTGEAIEHEACEIFGARSLRDWFRKPAGFFADHLKRYSKSRRQAPIYWPLSTDSGNYTLWLYYHRLTDQTLFTAVNEFIDPKLKNAKDNLNALRTKTNRSREDENELERLSNVSSELDDFRNDLLRIAEFWKPNLNDGVQITAAPLWKFFRLKKWRDTLKKTWDELEGGKYDWAHLALSIWPARVVRAAHEDRSIAIAHRLEDALWHEVEIKKSSKTGRVTVKHEWQPRELSEKELDAIVAKVKSGEIGTDNAARTEVASD